MNKPKIAIGCIVQWYEVEMYQEYLQSIITTQLTYALEIPLVIMATVMQEEIFLLTTIHLLETGII